MKGEDISLTDNQIKELNNILLEEKKNILDSLKYEEMINDYIKIFEIKNCTYQDIYNDIQTYKLSTNRRRSLKKVIESLDKIESGKYGICNDCERCIPFNELKTCPISDLCIDCIKDNEYENNYKFFTKANREKIFPLLLILLFIIILSYIENL